MNSVVKTRNISALLKGWRCLLKRRLLVELVEMHPTEGPDLQQLHLPSRVVCYPPHSWQNGMMGSTRTPFGQRGFASSRHYVWITQNSDGNGGDGSDTEDEDETGSAEVKKLDEDQDLQENLDEEKEGKAIAEETVRAMTEEMSSESDADAKEEEDGDPSKSVSVMDQVVDAETFLKSETFHGETVEQGRPRPAPPSEDQSVKSVSLTQLAAGQRRKLFWEYMESPVKKKHLLDQILLPKSLDEGEECGTDKSDMVRKDDFADFLVDVRTSQKAVVAGAIQRYRAMMVVGNFQGIVGFGLGKSATIQGAINKARYIAFKNLVAIPLYRQHTIYEAASAKVTATKVLMWPRSRGFGIVASPILHGCCDLIGIRDISIKVIGSRNRFNTIKGFFAALESIRSAIEVAEEKGVYMREVCLFRPPRSLDLK